MVRTTCYHSAGHSFLEARAPPRRARSVVCTRSSRDAYQCALGGLAGWRVGGWGMGEMGQCVCVCARVDVHRHVCGYPDGVHAVLVSAGRGVLGSAGCGVRARGPSAHAGAPRARRRRGPCPCRRPVWQRQGRPFAVAACVCTEACYMCVCWLRGREVDGLRHVGGGGVGSTLGYLLWCKRAADSVPCCYHRRIFLEGGGGGGASERGGTSGHTTHTPRAYTCAAAESAALLWRLYGGGGGREAVRHGVIVVGLLRARCRPSRVATPAACHQ
jgi:hypothetical protein